MPDPYRPNIPRSSGTVAPRVERPAEVRGVGGSNPPGAIPTAISAPQWVEVGTEFTQRCAFVALYGPTGSGRTTLALTAPGPIAHIHSAEKVAGVAERAKIARPGVTIRQHNFGFKPGANEQETANLARAKWGPMKNAFNDALNNWAKTTILDTEPDGWVLRRYSKFGTLNPQGDLRDLYTVVNADWRGMLKMSYRAQVETLKHNLITIHTEKDEYKDIVEGTPPKKKSVRTGRVRMEGNKEVKYWADVILYCWRDITDMQFWVRIEKGWFRGEVEGIELCDATLQDMGYSGLTIPALLAFITNTPEAEWAK